MSLCPDPAHFQSLQRLSCDPHWLHRTPKNTQRDLVSRRYATPSDSAFRLWATKQFRPGISWQMNSQSFPNVRSKDKDIAFMASDLLKVWEIRRWFYIAYLSPPTVVVVRVNYQGGTKMVNNKTLGSVTRARC